MTNRTRLVAAGLAALAAATAVTAVVLLVPRGKRPAEEPVQKTRPVVKMEIGELPPEASAWIDVHTPDKLWKALRANGWLARVAAEPLGQGLGAGWNGFLATQGRDLASAFDGAVLDLVIGKLLAEPFRVITFGGPGATGSPVVIVPRPSSAARGAYDLLEAVARNGSFEAPRCPGPGSSDPKAPPPTPIVVARWLLAEHAVYAGQRDGRLAFARSPTAVIQALCAAPPDVPATEGIDVSLSFSPDALGREAQLAATLLGLGPAPRLAFALEGDHLRPAGLLGPLAEPGRLAAAPPPGALLKLVPAEAGVVLLATLQLPEQLDRESLAAHLQKRYQGPLSPRPVAIVWNPRGADALPTEVAVIWPGRDAAALRDAFSGPNALEWRRACGHEVLASTGALASAILGACEGKGPSVLNGAPAVSAGLREPVSVGLGVNLGVLLSRLVQDSYAGEAAGNGKPASAPEIESARRLLEELPFVGLRGVARGAALVPGGYRS